VIFGAHAAGELSWVCVHVCVCVCVCVYVSVFVSSVCVLPGSVLVRAHVYVCMCVYMIYVS